MEKFGCGQANPELKKGKKKQAKDELDRLKQAEKKKRRLEKALATSAAIISELEKKKQKKKEEQERLDEEGAAIAEAVALRVLVGEDTEESRHFMLNNNRKFNPWDHSSNIGIFRGYQSLAKYSVEGFGWDTDAYGSGCKWNDLDIGESMPTRVHIRDIDSPSVELIAAQAVSSLQIEEDSKENPFSGHGAATVVFCGMLGRQQYG